MDTPTRLASLALAAAALACAPAAAQESAPRPLTARSAVYVEAGGNGLLYSLNYDLLFTPNLGARVGFGILPVFLGLDPEDDHATITTVPLMVNALFGRGSSHFELGAGATIASAAVRWSTFGEGEESASTVIPNGTIGYRYQRPEGGVVFRAGAIPMYIAEEWWVSVGVSFGRSF